MTKLAEILKHKPIKSLKITHDRRDNFQPESVATLVNCLNQLEELYISGLQDGGLSDFLDKVNITTKLKSLNFGQYYNHF